MSPDVGEDYPRPPRAYEADRTYLTDWTLGDTTDERAAQAVRLFFMDFSPKLSS